MVGAEASDNGAVKEKPAVYKTNHDILLEKAREILQSNCEFKEALKTSIDSFYRSLNDRRQNDVRKKIPPTGDRRKS